MTGCFPHFWAANRESLVGQVRLSLSLVAGGDGGPEGRRVQDLRWIDMEQ